MTPALTLLDGGMGQELVRRQRSRTGHVPTALWSSEALAHAPELVTELHTDYIAAGADVITMATYAATPERLERDGMPGRFDALQRAGARCALDARRASGQPHVQIAACLPPLVASYRADLQLEPSQARQRYRAIVACQREASDLMLCETMSSVQEARIAAEAALSCDLPVWVALSVADDPAGAGEPLLRGGDTLHSAVQALESLGVHALLLNCSTPEAIDAALPVLAATRLPFGVYANAFQSVMPLRPGGTVDALQQRIDMGPEPYAQAALRWRAAGASIIGGCCETTPAHIACLRERLPA